MNIKPHGASAQLPAVRHRRPPAHVARFVEILGPALAVRFLLRFGGAVLYLPRDPKGRSEAEKLIGSERLAELGRRLDANQVDVPIANRWLVPALAAEGMGRAEIARTVRLTARSVGRRLEDPRRRTEDGKSA